MLCASSSIQIWQRRNICLAPMCAWAGDGHQMLFIMCFQRWKQVCVDAWSRSRE